MLSLSSTMVLLWVVIAGQADGAAKAGCPDRIKLGIQRAKDPGSKRERAEGMERVAKAVKQCPAAVTEERLRQLIELLADDLDVVRFWAAVAIGHVGIRAASAIPPLERRTASGSTRL